jgi:hypothetical protein
VTEERRGVEAVSSALVALADPTRVVSGSRVGREVQYAVRPAALDTTARWMAAFVTDWHQRLASIKRIAEAADSQ